MQPIDRTEQINTLEWSRPKVALVSMGVALGAIAFVGATLAFLVSSGAQLGPFNEVGTLFSRNIVIASMAGSGTLLAFSLGAVLLHESHKKEAKEKQRLAPLMARLNSDYAPGVDREVFERVLNEILEERGLKLEPEAEDEIRLALGEALVYAGEGIKARSSKNRSIDKMVNFLIADESPEITWQLFKAVLVERDATCFKQFSSILKAKLRKLADNPPQTLEEEKIYDSFIGNLLSYWPFSYPNPGEKITVPVKINGKWKACEYTITQKMSLTPGWLAHPIPAYSLEAKGAPSILIFLGTTYPTGDGAMASALADFTPGMSVGNAPYHLGEEEIDSWLATQKQKVNVVGMSLGGALSFHFLRHHSDKVNKLQAYNPAGLYSWDWGDMKFNESDGPDIQIYSNMGDLVSNMGYFPEGSNVHLYRVAASREEGKSDNFLKAHAQTYHCFSQIVIFKSDPAKANKSASRHLLTGLHLILGPILIFPLLILTAVIMAVVKIAYYALTSPYWIYQWAKNSGENHPQSSDFKL